MRIPCTIYPMRSLIYSFLSLKSQKKVKTTPSMHKYRSYPLWAARWSHRAWDFVLTSGRFPERKWGKTTGWKDEAQKYDTASTANKPATFCLQYTMWETYSVGIFEDHTQRLNHTINSQSLLLTLPNLRKAAAEGISIKEVKRRQAKLSEMIAWEIKITETWKMREQTRLMEK